MKEIYVALQGGQGMVPVGVVRFDVDRRVGVFAYLPTYDGPPLDPVNLDYTSESSGSSIRLGPRSFAVDPIVSPGLLHGVFQDYLPGSWGMSVLRADNPEIRGMLDAQLLHWFGSRTVGAMRFFINEPDEEHPAQGIDELMEARRKSLDFQRTTAAMELNGLKNPAVASHGGAMPKASYQDEFGQHWLAKFDQFNNVRQYATLEYLAIQMAGKLGISVPETKLLTTPDGGRIFLTQRYDRQMDATYQRISMFSLLNSREVRDISEGDYRQMFKVLERVIPPEGLQDQQMELLTRMAMNVGLNIVDDHLRNHELRSDPVSGEWRLAPAFDLVPESQAVGHGCGLFGKPRATLDLEDPNSLAFWRQVAGELGFAEELVEKVVEEVRSAIHEEWPHLVFQDGMLEDYNQANAMKAMELGCGTSVADVEVESAQGASPRERS